MKKIIALTAIAMLLITLTPASTFATSEADTWTGQASVGWYQSNPNATTFIIDSAEDLAGLAELVDSNIYGETFEGQTIVLAKDLDLAGFKWTPIGTESNPFLGTFDGDNHTISNLNINDETSTESNIGLFGVVGSTSSASSPGSVIENVGIINPYILGSKLSNVGALVGQAVNTSISNSYTIGTNPVAGGLIVGGLVGDLSGGSIISNSYASVNVTGTSGSVGGLVGSMGNTSSTVSDQIINCYATGNAQGIQYVGGLVGIVNGNNTEPPIIENCYATGIVSGSLSGAGALYGTSKLGLYISNSYGNNSNTAEGGGSNGDIYPLGTNQGASLEKMKTEAFKNTLNVDPTGTAIQPFAIDPDFNGGYPYLVSIPQIMLGDGQTILQGEPLTIKITTPYFEESGTVTTVGDTQVPANKVTYSPGSTVATLSGDYTANLSAGTYSIEISNPDYGTARGTFTVTALASVPETGDNTTNLYALITIAIASILGIAVVAKRRKITNDM